MADGLENKNLQEALDAYKKSIDGIDLFSKEEKQKMAEEFEKRKKEELKKESFPSSEEKISGGQKDITNEDLTRYVNDTIKNVDEKYTSAAKNNSYNTTIENL